MRICHVAPELLPVPPVKGGAIERWIRDAAAQLASRGHDVHVVSRDHDDGARERQIDGVSYHFVTPDTFDRYKFEVLGGPFLVIDGVLQNLDGVISVKAARIAALRAGATSDSHDFH